MRFWDPESGRLIKSIDVLAGTPTQDKLIRDFVIAPDGDLIAAAGFVFDPIRQRIVHRIWLWDLTQDQRQREIDVPTVDLFCLAFAPDGETLATGCFAGAVQLWDVATSACRATISLGKSSIYSLSFAPDGKILAACEHGKGTRLWDLEQKSETLLADPLCGSIAPIFSADGRLMAVSMLGGETVLWDRTTGQGSSQPRESPFLSLPIAARWRCGGRTVGCLRSWTLRAAANSGGSHWAGARQAVK